MRTGAALTTTLFLGVLGCSAPGPVQTYEGSPRARADIAILKGAFEGGYRTLFGGFGPVDDRKDFHKVRPAFGGFPAEIHVLPGRYLFMIYCAQDRYYGYPSITLDVEPGMTYVVLCEQAPGEPDKMRTRLAQRYPSMRDVSR